MSFVMSKLSRKAVWDYQLPFVLMSWLRLPITCSNHSYELLRLFKSTRNALREALADAEVFITQIPTMCREEDDIHCHYTSKQFSCITFTPKDMQVKGKHDRPLYYTWYIGSSEVSRIQVDLGPALSIMPRKVMQHLGIPTH